MELNPADFESHYGREGLNHNQSVNIPYPFFAKKQGNSKKQAKNKQKVQGVRSKPTSKFHAQTLIILTKMEVHQIFLKVNPPSCTRKQVQVHNL